VTWIGGAMTRSGQISTATLRPWGRVNRRPVLWYPVPMKNEARLTQIMRDIDFRGLSRNKSFEAFEDPTVRDARDRLARIKKLAVLLSEDEDQAWSFSLSRERDRHGLWTLECRSNRMDARWVAKLRDFELEILRHHSRSGVIRPR